MFPPRRPRHSAAAATTGFQAFENVRGPSEDVASGNGSPQRAHPRPAFLRPHVDGAGEGVGKSVHVVRIDDERVVQLLRGARHLAEHQHAVLVLSCRDEFLGDEIHAVVQRADDAEVSETVQCHEAPDAERRRLIDHQRRPIRHMMPLVDVANRGRNLRFDLRISMQMRA